MNPEASLRRKAPAKLNLLLHIVGRRPDGYHLLESWIVFLDVGDELVAAAAADFSLAVEGPFASALGPDGAGMENLVARAGWELARIGGISPRAAVRLMKNLPVASGLGGGSSDAAAAIDLLTELWQISLPEGVLDDLALQLGADVPVCRRASSQWVQGIGEVLSNAPPVPFVSFVLVFPDISLHTSKVFAALRQPWSERSGPPEPAADAAQLASALNRGRNDLEQTACLLVPEIRQALTALAACRGCLLARMSGAGSTCFGLFAAREEASEAAEELRRQYPHWWVMPAAEVA